MRGSRGEWVVLVGLVAVMVGASVLMGGKGAEDPQAERPDPSTYNAKAAGGKGLYLWLQELGLQVRRWERPLTQLPDKATVLLVLRPRLPVEEQELRALEKWVRNGGLLLLADDSLGGPIPGVWAGAPALRFGLEPRLGGRPGPLRPAFPSRYAAGVEAIEPTGWMRFHRKVPEGWAPLFADRSGEVLALKRLGRGTLIALADPGILSNARLEVAGHARLALNIVEAHADGGLVLVDEFHHGHGQPGGLSRYVQGTALPWILAQAALAFLVVLVARGTRFGAPVPLATPARASSLEYVGALGDLYQRAGARRLAVEALAHSFRRRLTEALGARPDEGAARLGARAARRIGVQAEQVKTCLAPRSADAASDEALLKFARTLHRLEGRLRLRPAQPPASGAGESR